MLRFTRRSTGLPKSRFKISKIAFKRSPDCFAVFISKTNCFAASSEKAWIKSAARLKVIIRSITWRMS